MIKVPAHKQTDPTKAPGQVKTLGDYIQQKTKDDPKKLTFDEFWNKYEEQLIHGYGLNYSGAEYLWLASRENI